MGKVDTDFIQATEHRPKPSIIEAEGIPLIDLSPLLMFQQQSPNPSKSIAMAMETLVSEIGDACKRWGFFQVINHGVPSEIRKKIEEASKMFFAQPLEEKRKVKRDEVNPVGYYDTEHTKNVRDWKEVFDFLLLDPTKVSASHEPDDKEIMLLSNQWPQNPPNFREACEEYTQEVLKLSIKLLEIICLSLGLPPKRLNGFFEDQTSFTRLNYYPKCPFPDLVLGVGHHKDPGALSVLAQDDVRGLEVKRKTDGEWIRVKPIPNAFIINLGDLFQVWSNDKYESVEHRVMVNPEKARFSIPFFLFPAHDTIVKPLEELTDEQNAAKFKPYKWGKFMAARQSGNFKKLKIDNIQISDFRISS